MVAGAIGAATTIWHSLEDIEERLAKIDVKFKRFTYCRTRRHIVSHYNQIDVQVVWRPRYKPLRNPLKLVNAGSFGIPTVAFPETNYTREFDGYFLPAETVDKMIDGVKSLKNSESLYESYSEKLIEKTENYHIGKISKLYLGLANEY